MDLHGAAGPVLADLREQTGESSQVGVLDGLEVVYVDRLEWPHSLRLFNETGRRVPVHCTSSGKVLLAHLPDHEREVFLAAARSPADPAHDRRPGAAARRARRRPRPGLVRGRRGARDRRRDLAAPIRDAPGRVVAAISIGAPAARGWAPGSAAGWPRSWSRPARRLLPSGSAGPPETRPPPHEG